MDALSVVRRLGNGDLVADIAESLSVIAAEVVETGKKGTITITLEVMVQQIGDPMVIVRDQVKRNPPKRDPRGVLLYAVEGGLHTRDPRQTEMDFRVVESPDAEIRDAGSTAQTVREA